MSLWAFIGPFELFSNIFSKLGFPKLLCIRSIRPDLLQVVCVCNSECKLQLLSVLWRNIFRIRTIYFKLNIHKTPNAAADSTQYYNSLKMGWIKQRLCFQTLTTQMHTQKRQITTSSYRMHSLVPCYPLTCSVSVSPFLHDSKTQFLNFLKSVKLFQIFRIDRYWNIDIFDTSQ